MKKILLYCLLVFSGLSVFSQASFDLSEKGDPFLSATGNAHSFAATITAADMKSYLEVLASDEMEGRETGTEGQRKAAAFIAAHFERLGLPPIGDDGSYFQKIAYTSEKWDRGQISLHINGRRYRHLSDFYSFPSTNTNLDAFRADEVVFLGYGIDASRYSDYKGVDVKGKTILIYTGEPKKKNGKSQVTGTKKESEWTTNWKKKLETAYQHGVAMVLLIDPDMRDNISKNRSTLL
ncbi:MAG TPA: peptidase M28, partial [Bacteroidetes bacterium]|nr:peptidase M28 [Bacteroidota bacterium]